MQHNRLIQQKIWSANKVDSDFDNICIAVNGESEIPIVLLLMASLFFAFTLNVPSRPSVLYQKWHKNMGKLNPGVIWFWPAWNRISHIVTRATITYNAPTRNCPTADNGMYAQYKHMVCLLRSQTSLLAEKFLNTPFLLRSFCDFDCC